MGEGRFSTPHRSETPGPIFMKLEILTTPPRTRPRMQNFKEWLGHVGGLGKLPVLRMKVSIFFSFFVTPIAHRSHFWTHPHTLYVILRRSRQRSAFLGLERRKLKFDPFNLPKKRKNLDFKLVVNGQF